MASRINVSAPPGQCCPLQGGGGMITDKQAVPVQGNRYYRRLIGEGSLLVVPPQAVEAKPPQAAAGTSKIDKKKTGEDK